jgi:uncharacterized protein with NAD-binding domain and iron-sulfur cluster
MAIFCGGIIAVLTNRRPQSAQCLQIIVDFPREEWRELQSLVFAAATDRIILTREQVALKFKCFNFNTTTGNFLQ